MGMAKCWSDPGTPCISIGVARYDMVVVSKPSMAAVLLGAGWAHARGRRVGASSQQWVVARAVVSVVVSVVVRVEGGAVVKHACGLTSAWRSWGLGW